jgi:hypothetical protein
VRACGDILSAESGDFVDGEFLGDAAQLALLRHRDQTARR